MLRMWLERWVVGLLIEEDEEGAMAEEGVDMVGANGVDVK